MNQISFRPPKATNHGPSINWTAKPLKGGLNSWGLRFWRLKEKDMGALQKLLGDPASWDRYLQLAMFIGCLRLHDLPCSAVQQQRIIRRRSLQLIDDQLGHHGVQNPSGPLLGSLTRVPRSGCQDSVMSRNALAEHAANSHAARVAHAAPIGLNFNSVP